MINLDSIFKSRDITLSTKVRLVKAMVFPVVVYGCESWNVKKAEHQRINAFLPNHQFKASVLQCSAFFMVQLSHPYMTAEQSIALTRWTIVGKVMSLFFNMLSRLVITFLPRSKRLLISWLQSPSAVILEPPKLNSLTAPIVSPPICYETMGPDAMILVF